MHPLELDMTPVWDTNLLVSNMAGHHTAAMLLLSKHACSDLDDIRVPCGFANSTSDRRVYPIVCLTCYEDSS